MKKEFLPYDLALRMKALGFDEPCFGYYSKGVLFIEIIRSGKIFIMDAEDSIYFDPNSSCLAPTFSEVFDWFREKHGLFQVIDFNVQKEVYFRETSLGYSIDYIDSKAEAENYLAFKNSELACLIKLIEIVEENKK